jgi:hypothetical protein
MDPKALVPPRQALTTLAAPFRYRVVVDAEGWPVIPGRLGQIECHDGPAPAVYSTRPRIFARLWAVPGVRRWQVGDQEARGLVPLGYIQRYREDDKPLARLTRDRAYLSLAPTDEEYVPYMR